MFPSQKSCLLLVTSLWFLKGSLNCDEDGIIASVLLKDTCKEITNKDYVYFTNEENYTPEFNSKEFIIFELHSTRLVQSVLHRTLFDQRLLLCLCFKLFYFWTDGWAFMKTIFLCYFNVLLKYEIILNLFQTFIYVCCHT